MDWADQSREWAEKVRSEANSMFRIHTESKCACPCHIVNVGAEDDICGFCGCAPNMKPIPRNYRDFQPDYGDRQ
jgi:hypothetical protein